MNPATLSSIAQRKNKREKETPPNCLPYNTTGGQKERGRANASKVKALHVAKRATLLQSANVKGKTAKEATTAKKRGPLTVCIHTEANVSAPRHGANMLKHGVMSRIQKRAHPLGMLRVGPRAATGA